MKYNNNIIKNTIWVIKLNFEHLPVVTSARIIGTITQYGSSVLRSFVIGLLIDWTFTYTNSQEHDTKYIIYSLGTFGVYYLINSIGFICNNFGRNLSSFKLSYSIPETLLLKKLNTLDVSTLESSKVQNMINRYRYNLDSLESISRNILFISGIFITFVLTIFTVIFILPIPTILIVLVSIPGLITNKSIMKKLWILDKDMTAPSRKSEHVLGMITDPQYLKEIKLLRAYKYLKTYFDYYTQTLFKRKSKIYSTWSLFDVLYTLLTGLVILFGIFQIIELSNTHQISIGQIAFYIGAITSLGSYIDSFSAYSADYLNSSFRVTEMRELLSLKPLLKITSITIPLLDKPPLISLQNVSFKYPKSNTYALKDINLEIKPGEKIAIVGENGAGKTTLIKLISNIYPVKEGKIFINNDNLESLEPDSWFNNIGVLNQDFNTYNDLSVKENIALGRIEKDMDMEKIIEAAKKADAHEFIMKYKNQYEQILSERYEDGIRPSTGQWQKIAISRFFYRDAPILILDEPTASIDAVAEANIFDRIYEFIQNKTVIIISHRFSTVRNADKIIVLDKGSIVEIGSHEELLNNDGAYAYAFKLQAKGYV